MMVASGQNTFIKLGDAQAILKERKMLAANYILNRVLIHIVKKLKEDQLPKELGEKLEEMVFNQLKNVDP